MSSTNKTTHYEFPQYIGSDIPNILTDINPAFETIDTALYEQGQQITESEADLSTLEAAVTQATSDVTVMQGSIATMAGVLETTRALATDNKETIGQGTLDTDAQTLIGGVNELNAVKSGKVYAEYTSETTDTYAEMCQHLFEAITDITKIPNNAKLVLANQTIEYLVGRTANFLEFRGGYGTSSTLVTRTHIISSTGFVSQVTMAQTGNTVVDLSSTTVGVAIKMEIVG